mmetsp:Transcript_16692/g.49944  ORF Transcript_16692/g.49944 Transcript_16692/m.49944 type:complete len:380 (+) Transcript_16692:1129-2268(+)
MRARAGHAEAASAVAHLAARVLAAAQDARPRFATVEARGLDVEHQRGQRRVAVLALVRRQAAQAVRLLLGLDARHDGVTARGLAAAAQTAAQRMQQRREVVVAHLERKVERRDAVGRQQARVRAGRAVVEQQNGDAHVVVQRRQVQRREAAGARAVCSPRVAVCSSPVQHAVQQRQAARARRAVQQRQPAARRRRVDRVHSAAGAAVRAHGQRQDALRDRAPAHVAGQRQQTARLEAQRVDRQGSCGGAKAVEVRQHESQVHQHGVHLRLVQVPARPTSVFAGEGLCDARCQLLHLGGELVAVHHQQRPCMPVHASGALHRRHAAPVQMWHHRGACAAAAAVAAKLRPSLAAPEGAVYVDVDAARVRAAFGRAIRAALA